MIFDKFYLMESFLNYGSVSDPAKSYHLEFVCETKDEADRIIEAAGRFDIACGRLMRRNCCIVYLKDSEAISDLLTVMGAGNARFRYEDAMVLKEVRGSIQRRVNCETANISKTVSASIKQLEDINFINGTIGLAELPEGLREVARLRMEYPDMTLSELASMVPGVGRSGINHRFRKIAAIAADLRTCRKEGNSSNNVTSQDAADRGAEFHVES